MSGLSTLMLYSQLSMAPVWPMLMATSMQPADHGYVAERYAPQPSIPAYFLPLLSWAVAYEPQKCDERNYLRCAK